MYAKHTKTWRAALIAAIVILAALSLFLGRTDALNRLHSLEGVKELIQSAAPWSHLVFLLLQITSVILAPIPSNVTAMAGGACFGFPWGFFMTFVSVTCGSLLTFTLSRVLGQKWAQRLVKKKVSDKYLHLIQRKRDSFLLLVFLFPFFPDDIICILAGLTDIPFRRFALIVLCTRHWGLLVASLAGASLFSVPGWILPLLGIGGVLLFAFGLRYGDVLEEKLLYRIKD